MNWLVERDSSFGRRRIIYAAKRFDGASDRTLVTIFVVKPDAPEARRWSERPQGYRRGQC